MVGTLGGGGGAPSPKKPYVMDIVYVKYSGSFILLPLIPVAMATLF